MGRWLIAAGLVLLLLGLLVQFAPGLLSWFGKLPGDIRIQSERGGLFIPLTSMLIVSVLLTLLIHLLRRW
jgi:hypothetical protein